MTKKYSYGYDAKDITTLWVGKIAFLRFFPTISATIY